MSLPAKLLKVRQFMKDAQGRYRTESLFYETSRDRRKYPPIFTLKEEDHKGCLSMYRLYMEQCDPSEFYFARRVLGSYAHWEKLISLKWFQPHVEVWRIHMEAKLKGQAIDSMVKKAEEGNVQAAKWVATKGWEERTKPKRGRPSKDEIQREVKRRADHFETLEDDADRLGLR